MSKAGPVTGEGGDRNGAGRSRLHVRADYSEEEEEGSYSDDPTFGRPRQSQQAKTAPLQAHKSAPASSSSGMSDAIDMPHQPPPRVRKKRRLTNPNPRTRSISPVKLQQQTPSPIKRHDRAVDLDVDMSPEQPPPVFSPTSTPIHEPPHPSSDRPITPVPDYILDIHRRLCGQDPARTRRVKSPWRNSDPRFTPPGRVNSPSVSTRKRKLDPITLHQQEITARACDKALERRRHVEHDKALVVDLSSDSVEHEPEEEKVITPKKRKRGSETALSPIAANTLRRSMAVTASYAGEDMSTGRSRTSRALPVHRSAQPAISPLPRASMAQASRGKSTSALRSPQATGTINNLVSATTRRSQLSNGKQDHHTSFYLDEEVAHVDEEGYSALLATPSKEHVLHHKVSPPKTDTPTKGTSTTDFIFPGQPSPPPPPISHTSPNKSKMREFKPVAMDAETLMTWSLGPPRESRDANKQKAVSEEGDRSAPSSEGNNPEQGVVLDEDQPRLMTPTKRRGSDLNLDDQSVSLIGISHAGQQLIKKLAQSEASQVFPHLLPSPSDKPRRMAFASGPSPVKRPILPRDDSRVLVGETLVAPASQTIVRCVSADGRERKTALARTATILSETVNFPNSPVKHSGAADATSELPQPPRHTAVRRTRSAWPTFDFGDLPSKSPSGSSTPTPTFISASTSKRKSPAMQGHPSAEKQTKLAAFGFFGDKPSRVTRDFERDWDEEEDLAIDVEEGIVLEPLGGRVQSLQGPGEKAKKLGSVPEAPYHPSLRPAGIREMQRREREREDGEKRERSPEPGDQGETRKAGGGDSDSDLPVFPASSSPMLHVSSTDAEDPEQSSPTSESDEMNASTKEWWEGLRDRRSSEFGSL